MNFKSLPQLLDYFKEESTCIEYYEQIRWNGDVCCPHCGTDKVYRTKRGFSAPIMNILPVKSGKDGQKYIFNQWKEYHN